MDSSKGHETGKVAIVNIYELSEEWDNFKVLSFEKENEPELFEKITSIADLPEGEGEYGN